jgi:hypothetical protein
VPTLRGILYLIKPSYLSRTNGIERAILNVPRVVEVSIDGATVRYDLT